MKNLKEVEKEYPVGSLFYSATGNLNNKKLVVTKIIQAQGKDLDQQILLEKRNLVKQWNEKFPENIKFHFRDINLKKLNTERYLDIKSIEKDLLNETGGVIYCGTTKTWAKKC